MQIMEGDIIRTIRDNKDWIAHFHAGGVPGRHELDGTQELNWRAVASAIADTGFAGFVAHEFVPTPIRSRRCVRRWRCATSNTVGSSMTMVRQAKLYDVCIVGSGAGGGMAAYALTKAGADVVVLEAGGPWDNAKDSAMLTWPYESPRRGKSTKERPFGEVDACIGGWEIPGEPYTRAPGTEFSWWRARMVGGRTNHWGRISLRFGPYDFKRKSRDGLGDDWPISYDDVAPYYDRVDRLIGLFGSKESLPNEPNGVFLPPPLPRCHELLVRKALLA